METLAEWWSGWADWWASLPPTPEMPLPPPGDTDVITVVATVLLGLGTMGVVAAWVEGRFSSISAGTAVLALVMFYWVWDADRENWSFIRIPEAFVEMVARVIR